MRTRFLTLLVAVGLLCSVRPVTANEYDRNDSDNPFRLMAYVVHPVGVLLEYAITRPVHKLVSKPGWDYVMGHEATERHDHDMDKTADTDADAPYEVAEVDGGVRYTLVGEAVLFNPGSAQLTEQGRATLAQVCDRIQTEHPGAELVVEGHTDSQPIQHSSWKNNWELAGARAAALVDYMVGEAGFGEDRIKIVSYGETHNIVPNDTPERRQLNRRAIITATVD